MKPNKYLIPQTIIYKPSIGLAAILVAAFAVVLACGVVPNAKATATVSFTIDTTIGDGPGLSPWMDANRLGLADIPAYSHYNLGNNQYFWAATNTQLVTLYTNAGIRLISVGGNGTSGSQPSTNDLGQFFSFAQAASIQVNWVLSMSNATDPGIMIFTNQDETNALFIMQNYSNNLAWLSVGNEKDAKTTDKGGFGQTWTGFSEFWSYWLTYYNDVVNYVANHNAPVPLFGGPDAVAGTYVWAEWFAATNEDALGNYIQDMNMHWEPYQHSATDTMFEDALSMLSSNTDDASFPPETSFINWAYHGLYGFPASITEFNPYNFGDNGLGGAVGNTYNGYANALFALDAMHWWAQQGLVSLHWLDTSWTFFYTNVSNGNLEGAALMYGCAAYNEGGGSDAFIQSQTGGWLGLVAPITGWNNSSGVNNATAYAVADFGADNNCTNLLVTLINTSMTSAPAGRWQTNYLADFTVNMPYNTSGKPTHIYRMVLTQGGGLDYVTATNNITLGNADLNGAGPFQPQWEDMGVLSYPYYKATVTNLTAQILKFSCPNN